MSVFQSHMRITISSNEANQRFDRFLRKHFKSHPEITLTDIFSRIRKGAIKVNEGKKKENYRLQEDDIIQRDDNILTEKSAKHVRVTKAEKRASFSLEQITPHLIYEDDNWLVWNKPAGIVTHPGTKHTTDMTLHDIMRAYLHQTDQDASSTTFTPSFCFRLDKDTSGIIISAKTYEALQWLNEQIRERETRKRYLAIVGGKVSKSHTIEAPLFKGYDQKSGKGKMFINEEKGLASKTVIHPLQTIHHPQLGELTVIKVDLHTGRMHQIRVHVASLGYPIIGDLTYGTPVLNRIATKKCHITRQLLHSRSYGFHDPFADKEQTFIAPPDETFITLFPDLGKLLSSKKVS